MKKSTLGLIVIGILSAFHLAGCSNPDGPTLSDDELLKRGQAGRSAGAAGGQPPTREGMPGSSSAGSTGR